MEAQVSILFDLEPPAPEPVPEPDCFADLHLDRIVGWLLDRHEQYELAPLYRQPLHTVEAVAYRQAVVRDLERAEVRAAVGAFAERMRLMRRHLRLARTLHYACQRQRWFLDAVGVYCETVAALRESLCELELGSDGLRRIRDHVTRLCTSASFEALGEQAAGLQQQLAATRYLIHMNGMTVRVLAHEERPDIGGEVLETFAKFAQGAVKDYRARFRERDEMNHVEAQILDGVAQLHPGVFAELEQFCQRHRDYVDPDVARFDRELQFYLAYLELIAPLRAAGLEFCEPRVSRESKETRVLETFDLALARQLVYAGGSDARVVVNDIGLDGEERVIVLTGPNNGGKTTFARTFGQLHHLAALGLPVPGSSARLFLPDRVFTHFEREESIETLRGKFEDELYRIHAILEHATADSVIVLNEAFGSTTLHDAELVGTRVLEQLVELDALCVFVTFVDELAGLGETVVSMMSTVDPDEPAVRTFRVVRRAADGLAYAAAIAHKYGLGYETLKRRVAP